MSFVLTKTYYNTKQSVCKYIFRFYFVLDDILCPKTTKDYSKQRRAIRESPVNKRILCAKTAYDQWSLYKIPHRTRWGKFNA